MTLEALTEQLFDAVYDCRGGFMMRSVVRRLCLSVAELAIDVHGHGVRLEEALSLLGDVLRSVKVPELPVVCRPPGEM